MKIGYFTDSYLPSYAGTEISMHSFKKGLENLGNKIFIFAPYMSDYKDKDPDVFRFVSVRVKKEPEMRFALPFAKYGSTRKLFNFKLDIVHAQMPFSAGIIGKYVAWRQKIPFIYTHHTDYSAYSKVYFRGKKFLPALVNCWITTFSNLADTIIAPSYKVKAGLENSGVKKPIVVLPTGINLELFERTEKSLAEARRLREDLGISPPEKILISVGRMSKEKNVDFIIRAFAKATRKVDGIKLLLVGEGADMEKLKSLAKSLSPQNIIFAGNVPHEKIPTYYQASDLFVISSHTETQGLVVLEAAACSLPIVALADQAFEGMLVENENCFLIKEESTDRFAEKILAILGNAEIHDKFSHNSHKIAHGFSEQKQAEKMLGVYLRTLKR